MLIHYYRFNPTGNITLLVDTPVPRAEQAALAQSLMARAGGEQVGYLENATSPRAAARLQMMGGEFCGNATMSLGALLCRDGADRDLLLEVSGSEGSVPCQIRRGGDGWTGTVRMPLPQSVEAVALDTDGGPLTAPVVRLPGIAHLILPPALIEAELRRRLPDWNRRIGADALGALRWDSERRFIDPLVYVPSAGTLVREHGCGSGTAAMGCFLALEAGHSLRADIRQPGGIITASATLTGGAITALDITGRVRLEGEDTVTIPEQQGKMEN